MGEVIRILDGLNSVAVKSNTAVNAYGALATAAAGLIGKLVSAIRDREARGEDTTDLVAAISAFGTSVDALKAANDAYWLIPEKPADQV